MTAKKVFVTGAAGQTGIHTVKWLASQGKNLDVWAGMRKGEEGKQEHILRTHSVRPTPVEASDPESLKGNFREVQDLFIIPPSTEDKVKYACNYIDAARASGVKFVLLLSMVGADRAHYTWAKQFHQIEQHLRGSGVENWCILRTPFYMQNLLLYRDQVCDGYLPLPIGNGRFVALDCADVGVAAGHILNECAPHKGKTYELTGPTAMSGDQMAHVFSSVLNSPVTFKDISPDEAKDILKKERVPDVEIQGLLDFYDLVRRGDPTTTTTNDDFKKLTGANPTTLEEFVQANKHSLMKS